MEQSRRGRARWGVRQTVTQDEAAPEQGRGSVLSDTRLRASCRSLAATRTGDDGLTMLSGKLGADHSDVLSNAAVAAKAAAGARQIATMPTGAKVAGKVEALVRPLC